MIIVARRKLFTCALAALFQVLVLASGTEAAATHTKVLVPGQERDATFAPAEVRLTLPECVAMAMKNNRAIEQAGEDRESARWALSEARRAAGPQVSWSMSGMRIGGESYDSARQSHRLYGTPSYDNEFTHSAQISLPVYTGGQLEGQRDAARSRLSAADLTLENIRQEVRYRTRAAYYQVLQSANLVTVQKEAVTNLEEHLATVNTQYEIGTVAMSDVLATSVQLANQRQSLVTAESNHRKAMITLGNIIGLPVSTPLTLADEPEAVEFAADEQEAAAYALTKRPDRLAAEANVKSAEAAVQVAKAGNRPKVSLSVKKNIAGEGASFKHDHSEAWSVGATAEWNVFDNGVTAAKVKEEEAALRKAKSYLRETDEAIEMEVATACTDLAAAQENIRIMAEAVREAEEDYVIAKVRYEEGVDTNLAVMDAQEKLVAARTNYYTAVWNAHTAKAALDKAMGVPVAMDPLLYHEAALSGETADEALAAARLAEDTE